jgi:endonuclease/exonuclease/phosphatase family metal-dependent hydrolase
VERLKVLSLNIWNRQGPWERRLALIRRGLEELAPDVVGLQEVLSMAGAGDQAAEIAAGLGYHVHVAPVWEIGGGVAMGNALLSRYPFAATDRLALPAAPGAQAAGVAFAVVDAPCGRVPVFCTHLSWKLHHTHVRIAQVLAVVEHVRRLAPMDGFPPVLLGDFNADPDADEMRYLRGLTPLGGKGVYFADCWLTCNPEAGHGGFTYDRRNPYALRAHEPSRRLDYVYVRGPDRQLRGEPLVARVVLDEAEGGVYASDHYGVYAEIQAAARPLDPY